jgi:hypothetical protein
VRGEQRTDLDCAGLFSPEVRAAVADSHDRVAVAADVPDKRGSSMASSGPMERARPL